MQVQVKERRRWRWFGCGARGRPGVVDRRRLKPPHQESDGQSAPGKVGETALRAARLEQEEAVATIHFRDEYYCSSSHENDKRSCDS